MASGSTRVPRRFGFRSREQSKKIKDLSGGERNRAQLASVVREGGNVRSASFVRYRLTGRCQHRSSSSTSPRTTSTSARCARWRRRSWASRGRCSSCRTTGFSWIASRRTSWRLRGTRTAAVSHGTLSISRHVDGVSRERVTPPQACRGLQRQLGRVRGEPPRARPRRRGLELQVPEARGGLSKVVEY